MGHNTTSFALISALRQSFCRTGVPDVFWSDQGPQFMSKQFHDFASQWGFKHATSTPRYPQSNGKSEATVKSMKKLIRTSWRGRSVDEDVLTRALLQYRNTPSHKDGLAPAQKLYGTPVQDTLPAHHRAFSHEWQKRMLDAEKSTLENKERAVEYYNQHAHTLPDIRVGSNVAVHNSETKQWDIYGVVVDVGPYRRYSVKLNSGRRNRRFLHRRIPASIGPCASVVAPLRERPRCSSRPCHRSKRLIEEITF